MSLRHDAERTIGLFGPSLQGTHEGPKDVIAQGA